MNPFVNSPLLFETEYWGVTLNWSQYYVGRCIVFLRRPLEDPMQLKPEEILELWFNVFRHLALALGEEFQPERINYCQLGNEVGHVHWHVIPRYPRDRTIAIEGVVFADENAGGNYAPYPKEPTPIHVRAAIHTRLVKRLNQLAEAPILHTTT